MSEDLVKDEQLVPGGATVVLPPYGFVHLQAKIASDLDVVNAARVSFAKQSEWVWRTADGKEFTDHNDACDYDSEQHRGSGVGVHEEDRRLAASDEAVLRYLLFNKHGTPFEHTFFKFHVRAPIFVFREWHRHRIGVSINEESARYSQLEPHFYVPPIGAWREQKGKPGKYTFIQMPADKVEIYRKGLETGYKWAYEEYTDMLDAGIAKEIARSILPVGIYSQMIWACNARSLMNFLSLRNAPTAQREIRLYAEAMEDMFAKAMPVTHDAFVINKRVSP